MRLWHGCIIDQVANKVHEAPSEASDCHSRNASDVARSPLRKGKTHKGVHLKVMKVRWPTSCGIRVPNVEIYSKLLEKYVLPEYKDELLQEAFMNSVHQYICALAMV